MADTERQEETLLRTSEVARRLGVSSRTIRLWSDAGKIACRRTFGGHRLFAESEIDRVLAFLATYTAEDRKKSKPQ